MKIKSSVSHSIEKIRAKIKYREQLDVKTQLRSSDKIWRLCTVPLPVLAMQPVHVDFLILHLTLKST